MKQTDITGFVEHNMKAWKEGVQQVRRPPSVPIFSLVCTVSSGGRSPMLNIYVFYSVHITHMHAHRSREIVQLILSEIQLESLE